jgi:AAA+ ATPase superfamily predicted ATPase
MMKSETMNNEIFPQGLATGQNFCNRVEEQERLLNNILTSRATLIMSPRRYGKTSLVTQVISKLKTPFANIDLYSELEEVEVQNSILTGIGNIVYAVESTTKKAMQFATEFFSEMNISFRYKGAGIEIELNKSNRPPAKTILSALKKLDEILLKRKKRAVLFFDEFQRVAEISSSGTIEGAIRHVAQQSNSISFVFSGSNRHLLDSMFYDRTKPLYKLCDRITLDRIGEDEYRPFLQNMAKKKWLKLLSEAAIDAILHLSERHPYYVNVLCHKLWFGKKPPIEEEVFSTWYKYSIEEKSNILSEIDLLSRNQSKMLISIAKYGDRAPPMSKEFLNLTNFSLSSASQAIKTLSNKDYLYLDNKGRYQIVDPLIKYLFQK